MDGGEVGTTAMLFLYHRVTAVYSTIFVIKKVQKLSLTLQRGTPKRYRTQYDKAKKYGRHIYLNMRDICSHTRL